jgi:hypothetical protein
MREGKLRPAIGRLIGDRYGRPAAALVLALGKRRDIPRRDVGQSTFGVGGERLAVLTENLIRAGVRDWIGYADAS